MQGAKHQPDRGQSFPLPQENHRMVPGSRHQGSGTIQNIIIIITIIIIQNIKDIYDPSQYDQDLEYFQSAYGRYGTARHFKTRLSSL
jgi:hypothetical protein